MTNITFEQFNEWVAIQGGVILEYAYFDDENVFRDDGVQFHEGDYEVGVLHIAPCLVVQGNLTVYEKMIWEFECGLLVVTGDLHIPQFNFPLNGVIQGNLIANEVSISSSRNCQLTVGGNIYAKSVIENGHVIEVRGQIESPVIESRLNMIRENGKLIAGRS